MAPPKISRSSIDHHPQPQDKQQQQLQQEYHNQDQNPSSPLHIDSQRLSQAFKLRPSISNSSSSSIRSLPSRSRSQHQKASTCPVPSFSKLWLPGKKYITSSFTMKRPALYQKKNVSEKKQMAKPRQKSGSRFWKWRPFNALRVLMGKQKRFDVVFHMHVHIIQGLPSSMDGLRLVVKWSRKDELLGQTMPSKVFHGVAEFRETLRHPCTVLGVQKALSDRYSSMIKYTSKLFTVSVVDIHLNEELEVGRHHVDLSQLLPQPYIDHEWANSQINPSRSWNANFDLSGMAKGSSLIVTFDYSFEECKGSDVDFTYENCKRTLDNCKGGLLRPHGDWPDIILKHSVFQTTMPQCNSTQDIDVSLRHCIDHLNLDSEGAVKQGREGKDTNDKTSSSSTVESDHDNSFEFRPDLKCFPEDCDFRFPSMHHFHGIKIKQDNDILKPHELIYKDIYKVNCTRLTDISSVSRRVEEDVLVDENDCSKKVGTDKLFDEHKDHIDSSGPNSNYDKELDDEIDLVAKEFLELLGISEGTKNTENSKSSSTENQMNRTTTQGQNTGPLRRKISMDDGEFENQLLASIIEAAESELQMVV